MTVVWVLVTLIGNQVIESGVTFRTAKSCFEQAASLQVEADKALGAAATQPSPATRPTFSCIVAESLGE